MTGRGLLKRLLRNERLLNRYHNPRLTPMAAWPVLDAIVSLAAASDEPGVFRPDLAREGFDTMPSYLAHHLRRSGCEEEIASCVAALVRAELVTEDGDAFVIPIPASRSTPVRSETARRNGSSGGRPGKGETAEEAKARRQTERENAMRAQGFFPLAVPGGRSPGNPAETQDETQGETQDGTPVGSAPGSGLGFENRPLGFSRNAGVLDKKESAAAVASESSIKTTAAAADSSFTSPARRDPETQEKPSLGFSETQEQPKAGFSETQAKTQATHDGHWSVAVTPEAIITDEAVTLAALARQGRNWSAQKVKESPAVMQYFLDSGHTSADIRAAIELKAGTEIRGARYFGAVLGDPPTRSAPASPLAPAPRLTDPRLSACPAYRDAPRGAQGSILQILELLELPDTPDRVRRLSFYATSDVSRAAFSLVAAQMPNLWALAGREPPDTADVSPPMLQRAATG